MSDEAQLGFLPESHSAQTMTSDELLLFFSFQQNSGRLVGAGSTGCPFIYYCIVFFN